MTNEKISEDDRSKIIAEMIDEFSKNYPDLEHTATKQELSETELRLTKEIKELDSRLTKEIKELDSRLSKEIKELELKLIKEIKELDSRLSKEIEGVRLEIANTKNDIIKWVIGLMFAQSALIVGVIKFLN
jgi:exonuclease VII large subunit